MAVIHHGQQGVRIERKVDTDEFGPLVHNMVDEPRSLIAEAIVVLPHDMEVSR